MKCPKCGYLGFETSERCRNCGYDFSLSVQVDLPDELPLHSRDGAGAPLADFNLSDRHTPYATDESHGLDLDRIIGSDEPEEAPRRAVTTPQRAATVRPSSTPPATRVATPPGLPLFSPVSDDLDDAPLVAAPRPARPPLSVRRTTPEIPRGRPRSTRVTPQSDDDALMALHFEPAAEPVAADAAPVAAALVDRTAGHGARLVAAIIDLALLGAIDAAVLYLTLAIAGLTIEQLSVIPRIPLVAFLMIMNGGYLVMLTAASGQTIGKMITGICVMADDGNRVDVSRAALRAAGCAISLVTLGLGYVPAFASADRRALQDRIAGTRVVDAK